MFSCIIIEDQKNVRKSFALMLNQYHYGIISIIGFADNVKDATELINKQKPDVVFMDIKINGGTAFDVLNKIEYKNFHLIFTTAYQEHAIRAFKYSAIDYLIKPIDIDELKNVIEKITLLHAHKIKNEQLLLLYEKLSASLSTKQRLVLSTQKQVHIIYLYKIIRLEAAGVYTNFYINDKEMTSNTIMVSKPIGEYEDLLLPFNFIRIHQSHIINIDHLIGITKDGMALLADNSEVPIAQRKKDFFISTIKQMNIQKNNLVRL